MLIKLKKGKTFPSLKSKKSVQEVRAVATWYDHTSHTEHSKFVDSQEELDNAKELCDSVSVLFQDGSYVELPVEVFIDLFAILPEGELTDALYGD